MLLGNHLLTLLGLRSNGEMLRCYTQQNAAALEEFMQCWCIGRGDPIDREVLEASGAVSDRFIDPGMETVYGL